MYTIRIMTYNIHRCQGTDGHIDPARVLEIISRAGPDIVALQEVGGLLDGDQAAWLGERLAMKYYGPTVPDGNAFLSYYPLRAVRHIDIQDGRCLCADVNIAGRSLHLFNVRLHEKIKYRRCQIARLLDENEGIRMYSSVCPVLLLGDFGDSFWPLSQPFVIESLALGKTSLLVGNFSSLAAPFRSR